MRRGTDGGDWREADEVNEMQVRRRGEPAGERESEDTWWMVRGWQVWG